MDCRREGKSFSGGQFSEIFVSWVCKNLQVCEQGVNIANATVEGGLNLDNLEIGYPVYFKHCIFNGRVSLKRSYFKKDLSFQGSKFLKSTNFCGIKIDGDCNCIDTIFENESLWVSARIGLEFQADGAEFRSKTAVVDFNSMKVTNSIHMERAKNLWASHFYPSFHWQTDHRP